jgi:hypothetical protein
MIFRFVAQCLNHYATTCLRFLISVVYEKLEKLLMISQIHNETCRDKDTVTDVRSDRFYSQTFKDKLFA